MSTRLTKGRALAGTWAQDKPGEAFGGIPFNVASTAVVSTAFQFPATAVLTDVFVKITSVAGTSGTLNIGLYTNGAASSGVSNALAASMTIGTVGIFAPSGSTGAAAATYGSYLIGSTTLAVSIRQTYSIAATTGLYNALNFTPGSTLATVGTIYPIFYELL